MQCGRGDACFAARYAEVESESGAEDDRRAVLLTGRGGWGEEDGAAETTAVVVVSGQLEEVVGEGNGNGTGVEKAGYWRQEIEGIGGVVKQKVKRRVKVGRAVREFEDERECAGYLGRERRGEERSWCGWCARVVPGERDLIESTPLG